MIFLKPKKSKYVKLQMCNQIEK